jgi:hypothetical protein
VPTLDVRPGFLARLGERDSTSLFDTGGYGHLTREGYRWLAEAVRGALAPW